MRSSFIKGLAIIPLLAIALSYGPASAGVTVWEKEEARLDLTGDIRFRYETDHEDRGSKPARDRDRTRVRLRLGTEYRANANVLFGARLATEADDDHSTNHDFSLLGGGSPESSFGLDMAYIKLDMKPFWIWMGKKENDSWDATGLTWDPDLNPEGAAMGLQFGEGIKTWIHAGYFIVNETYYAAKDDTMISYQAGASFGEDFSLKAAMGGYSLSDSADNSETGLSVPGGSAGYLHFMAEIGGKGLPLHPALGAQFATSNVDKEKHIGAGASDSDRQAAMVYLKLKPGPVSVQAGFWDVGFAAVPALGAFNADNFAKTSNYTGWDITVGFKAFGALNAEARYFQQEVKNENIKPSHAEDAMIGKGNKRTRFQINLSMKF